MSVERNGESIGSMSTERRFYPSQGMTTTEVGIRSTPFEDLYLVLGDVKDFEGVVANDPGAQQIVAEVQVNPLVGWIWYGGLILTIGSLIALWPVAEASTRSTTAPQEKEGNSEPLVEAFPA